MPFLYEKLKVGQTYPNVTNETSTHQTPAEKMHSARNLPETNKKLY